MEGLVIDFSAFCLIMSPLFLLILLSAIFLLFNLYKLLSLTYTDIKYIIKHRS